MTTFNQDELELLAAGYVLDDLDEAEMVLVEQLIESSPAMREQIRQSMAVMGVLATDVQPMSPPASLKNKINSTFKNTVESPNIDSQVSKKNPIGLDNWFQEIFDSGWQVATELLGTSNLTPAFRNSGVEGAKLIWIASNETPIILILRVRETSVCDRDVVVEILPQLERQYLPSGLQLMLLDSDGDTVMEATTRQENKNLKFDFTGTCGEIFSIKLEFFNNFFREDFLL